MEKSQNTTIISKDGQVEGPTSPEADQNPQSKEAETKESRYKPIPDHTPKEFEVGPWLDPKDDSYGRGKQHQDLMTKVAALAHGLTNLESTESALIVLAKDKPDTY